MRGRLCGLLALVLLLSGCSWTEGSYVSVTPHQVRPVQTAEGEIRPVANYTELRSALVGMIDGGETKGLFSLTDYPREEVQRDVERAVEYARKTYPVGAYAVERIGYDVGTGLGTRALSVDIVYRRTREQISSIHSVRWASGAQGAVEDALDEAAGTLVLKVAGYQEMDFSEMVRSYAERNPDRVMETPGVTVKVFPEDRGETRVVELTFHYRTDRHTLRTMREQVQPVFSSATLYVTGQADDRTKFQQLHTFLTERFTYTYENTVTPAWSLLCRGVGDSRAFSLVYAAMCSRIGLEAEIVSGTREGETVWWNRVKIDGEWYHLDLKAQQQFQPMTDEEMTGYEWEH